MKFRLRLQIAEYEILKQFTSGISYLNFDIKDEFSLIYSFFFNAI